MRSAGLAGVSRRKGAWTTRRDPNAVPAPDLVDRRFVATRLDQLWVADITDVPTWAGFLYLAVVLDAFSRRIVGSVDDAYDNAMCESFFATLECELLSRRRFRNQVEARMAVFDFIEGWYNTHRRRSALDYESPMSYEKRAQASG